ncbi:MAG TPA: secretion system protein E [Zetaproteobacteria bacterium]|nr:secretion system protein E [Zetaproteobacteria bacterium]
MQRGCLFRHEGSNPNVPECTGRRTGGAMPTSVNKSTSLPTGDYPELNTLPGGTFARILLQEGIIDERQLDKATRVQKRLGSNKLISTILLELNMISEDDHRRMLRKHGKDFRFGDLQCEMGHITLEQLQEAIDIMQRKPGARIGEVLIQREFINERELAQGLSDQLGIPLIHIDLEMINLEVTRKFGFPFLKKNLLIPYEEGEHSISLVCSDPLNKAAIREIEEQSKKKASLSIGVRSVIETLINRMAHGAGTTGGNQDSVQNVVDAIFLAAVRNRASDIHIEPLSDRVRIRLRMDGVLVHHTDMHPDLALRVISAIKVMSEMDIADTRRHQDGRMYREVGHVHVDFRVSTYVTLYGENTVMRILRRDGGLKSLEQLQMNKTMLNRFKHEALDVPTGVIIITGPTGSGKTTTLYAGVDYLNQPNTKIITLEDPVEFAIDGIMQCSVDVKAGRDFNASLKAVMRQDPDVIVLGEIRDKTSAEVSVQAALTGHKVLTTFHTEDTIGGLLRLIDMGIETFLISSTVVSILAQRLARTICPDCRQAYLPDPRIARMIGLDEETLNNHTFHRGIGCATCNGTGYFGRTGLHELLVLNDPVREAILARKTSHEVRDISCATTKLVSLMENGMYKVLQGLTTVEEVYRITPRSHSNRTVNEVVRLMEEDES